MPWYAWVVLAELAFSGLYKVSQVGKYRKPVSGSEAVYAVIEIALLMWAVVVLGVHA